MSRVGNAPIALPDKVEVAVDGETGGADWAIRLKWVTATNCHKSLLVGLNAQLGQTASSAHARQVC